VFILFLLLPGTANALNFGGCGGQSPQV
jgi:hypothetical protein